MKNGIIRRMTALLLTVVCVITSGESKKTGGKRAYTESEESRQTKGGRADTRIRSSERAERRTGNNRIRNGRNFGGYGNRADNNRNKEKVRHMVSVYVIIDCCCFDRIFIMADFIV